MTRGQIVAQGLMTLVVCAILWPLTWSLAPVVGMIGLTAITTWAWGRRGPQSLIALWLDTTARGLVVLGAWWLVRLRM
jgi:hypothetical protein